MRYPAASPYVVAVGGTALRNEPSSSRGWSEEVWNDSQQFGVDVKGRGGSSGCSLTEPRPKWQTAKSCTKRLLSDVAANASENVSPVSVYDSFETEHQGAWTPDGGTSASAPFMAADWALSTSYSKSLTALGAEALYKDPGAFFDITSGTNGPCTPPSEDEYWCTAGVGLRWPDRQRHPRWADRTERRTHRDHQGGHRHHGERRHAERHDQPEWYRHHLSVRIRNDHRLWHRRPRTQAPQRARAPRW